MELSEYLKQIVNDDQWVYENDCDLSARGITPDIVDEKYSGPLVKDPKGGKKSLG